eukprot:TRINITY_DN2166_c0_g1_i1.p1 TRINITY_DN2166_c0_g1~~TRINITY_DN2166_c0_g1_i1.p1  ORF type:complete len:173 (-),score=53.83 TRINITY_DN2166_c0_g1_i1:335-853(-)
MSGKVQTQRRTWDKNLYKDKAFEREEKERIVERPTPKKLAPGEQRKNLEGRDFAFDFDDEIGKVRVMSTTTSQSQRGGFYCEVCDCTMKDSANYVDHLNGKKHQRMLGMSMRTKRSSLKEVQEKLRQGKRKREETEYDFQSNVEKSKKQSEEEKQQKKEERKAKRRKESTEE